MSVDTVIKGGTIVTASEEIDAAVAIDGEQIAAVGRRTELPSAERTIDASGKLVMPGVVDPHVHVRDHISADSYATATAAAALGGVTSIIDFAWQGHHGQDEPWTDEGTLAEGIETKRALASDEAVVDYAVHAGILREDEAVLAEIPDIVADGVTSFKILVASQSGLEFASGVLN